MKRRTYVIRKVAYHYSDEYLYVHTLGGIHRVYHDHTEALRELQALESEAFRSTDFGNIEQFSPCGSWTSHHHQRVALDRYLREHFGSSFLQQDDGRPQLAVEPDSYLPEGITDEQIMQIRELTGVRFHELGVFEDEVVFYGIWLSRENRFYSVDVGEFGESVYFFNTYDEANEGVKKLLAYALWGRVIEGTLEELTDQPSMLQSLTERSQALEYDRQRGVLRLSSFGNGEELLMLNALLRQPLFEIRAIPLDVAEQIPHTPFEVM